MPEFNIREFGWARGVWNADRALSEMLRAVLAAGNGLCRIPKGTYKFTKNAGGVGNVTLVGEGYDTVIDATVPEQFFSGGNLRNVAVLNMRFTGAAEKMLAFSRSSGLRFVDLWISGATRPGKGEPAAIRLDGCSDVEFTRVKCFDNGIAARDRKFFGADIQLNGGGEKGADVRFSQVVCSSRAVEANVLIYDSEKVTGSVEASGAAFNPTTGHSGYGVALYSTRHNPGASRGVNLTVTARNTGGSGFYCAGVSDLTFNATCSNNGASQPDISLPVGGVALNGCSDVHFGSIDIDNSGKDGVVFANCTRITGTSVRVGGANGWGVRLRGTANHVTIERITVANTLGGLGDASTAEKSALNFGDITINSTKGVSQGIALFGLRSSTIRRALVQRAGGHGIDISSGSNSNNVFCQLTAFDCGAGAPGVYTGILLRSDSSVLASGVARNDSTSNQKVGLDLAGVDLKVGVIQASQNTGQNVRLGRRVVANPTLSGAACKST